MGGTDGGDEGPIGAGDVATEPGEFANPLCSHLQDGIAVLWLQAQEGERVANFGVVGSVGFEGWCLMTEDGGDGFFRAGFAVAAGDADEGSLWLALCTCASCSM